MLADWIGSDETRFPFCAESDGVYMHTARANAHRAVRDIGLNPEDQRRTFLSPPCPSGFGQMFNILNAGTNAIQEPVTSVASQERLVVVESETGSGKTEAAPLRFARLYDKGLVDGLNFALPTRAAASQIHGRVTAFVRNLFLTGSSPEPVLAVPGYVRAGDAMGKHLPDNDVWWDDYPDVRTEKRRWAAASTKRFLAAQIAVGTVDQAMMSVLQVRHAHMRAACLACNLLVVDEVPASDTYMSTILEHLLRAHLGADGYAIPMSATLGSAARCRWLAHKNLPPLREAIDETPYPAVSTPEGITAAGENGYAKTVALAARATMSDHSDTARRALLAGCRRYEIVTLKWEHLDFEHDELRLRDVKTGARAVPLSPAAEQVLTGLPRRPDNPWLFPGRVRGTRLRTLNASWQVVRKGSRIEDVRLHDLRHSFASAGSRLGRDCR